MQQKGVDRGKPDLRLQLNTMVRQCQCRLDLCFFFWGGLQAGVFRCKLPVAGDGKVVGTVRYRMQT